MHTKWKTWAHVTKLDPDKHLNEEEIAEIATSGTDALILSGTLNITKENMSEPVSYTHLRAHETPEHLVCRLLLEKKKKQKQKHI